MSAPLISVVMPAYNAKHYVAEAVQSILDQTFRDFEFVIIDDGSTDRTPAILERYAARDHRIRLISRPNKGLVATLNEGLGLARGELIARMDADDVALPERFALQVAFLRAHPEVVCLGGAVRVIDAAGRILLDDRRPLDDATLQEMALTGHTPLIHPAVMMRRDDVMAVGGYDEAMKQSEDLDLWLRLGERGALASLPDFILKYRIHDRSKTEVHTDEQSKYVKLCTDRACDRRGIARRVPSAEECRPGRDRGSKHDFSLKYGWWGFATGERTTALHYALQAIRWAPWRRGGWHLLACALLKPVQRMG
jgi:glycosyltransferase involved in cell wall biosynthesis